MVFVMKQPSERSTPPAGPRLEYTSETEAGARWMAGRSSNAGTLVNGLTEIRSSLVSSDIQGGVRKKIKHTGSNFFLTASWGELTNSCGNIILNKEILISGPRSETYQWAALHPKIISHTLEDSSCTYPQAPKVSTNTKTYIFASVAHNFLVSDSVPFSY